VNWGHPHDSIIIQGATSHASGAEITKLLSRPPVPVFLRRERYRTLGNRREATGSVVTELVCASGSERSGQFCSQRSEFCRSRDRNFPRATKYTAALSEGQRGCLASAARADRPNSAWHHRNLRFGAL